MNKAASNKVDRILLWTIIVAASIGALVGFIFRKYASTDFFDHGEAVDFVMYTAIGFIILSIWALALNLPASPNRRGLIVAWLIIAITALSTSFPLTIPYVEWLDPIPMLAAPACTVLMIIFGISVARGYDAQRLAKKAPRP